MTIRTVLLVGGGYMGRALAHGSPLTERSLHVGQRHPCVNSVAVGGCAFAASVGLIYYLRRNGTYSGTATQAAGSDQHTGRLDSERPLSPFSEMLPSAYRFDQGKVSRFDLLLVLQYCFSPQFLSRFMQRWQYECYS